MQSNSPNDKQNGNPQSGPVVRRWQTDLKRFLLISAVLALPFVVLTAYVIWAMQRDLDESRRPLFHNNHTEIHNETGFGRWVLTPGEYDGQGRRAFVDFKRNVIAILNSRDVEGQRLRVQSFAADDIVVSFNHDGRPRQVDIWPNTIVVVGRDGSIVRSDLNADTALPAGDKIKQTDAKQRDFRVLCDELLTGADRETAIAVLAR